MPSGIDFHIMQKISAMQRVFLIGYMGAGKTTLGKALAAEMKWTFVDLDHFIEARRHKNISQIFSEVGESGFRELERSALREVASFEDTVIALGGGTPCFFDNMEIVNRAGHSIYLKPSEEVLLRRLVQGKAKRPIIAGKSDAELLSFIRANIEQREPYYRRAEWTIGSDRLENMADISAMARKVAALLTQGRPAASEPQEPQTWGG